METTKNSSSCYQLVYSMLFAASFGSSSPRCSIVIVRVAWLACAQNLAAAVVPLRKILLKSRVIKRPKTEDSAISRVGRFGGTVLHSPVPPTVQSTNQKGPPWMTWLHVYEQKRENTCKMTEEIQYITKTVAYICERVRSVISKFKDRWPHVHRTDDSVFDARSVIHEI